MRKLLYAALSLVVIASDATAADEQPPPMSTADFLTKCNSDHTWCVASVKDAQDMDLIMSVVGAPVVRRKYCVPSDLDPEARTVLVLAWLNARHDDLDGKPAWSALQSAEIALWPCRKSN